MSAVLNEILAAIDISNKVIQFKLELPLWIQNCPSVKLFMKI